MGRLLQPARAAVVIRTGKAVLRASAFLPEAVKFKAQ